MLEGLWVVQFVKPEPAAVDLLSGVIVIETGRILGHRLAIQIFL